MWALSDPETFPAPANTPSAFNSPYFGITMLNAQLLEATDFRIGIADIRGDGRPDYRYHARVLYGDHINPARASVAGGTPFAIQGYGFQANTQVNIATKASALAVSANQIVATAPANADGLQDVALLDPPTQGGSTLSGVLTYGAGPSDTIKLLAGGGQYNIPVGGQAPTPILVQAVAPDGVTPVNGASVFFSATPAAAFSVCGGAGTCTVLTDKSGQAATLVSPLSKGSTSIAVQLAPASYPNPQQVQLQMQSTETSLDISLFPQRAWVAQGATVNVNLTARVLSNGKGLSGQTVNFCQLTPGKGCLPGSWSVTVMTDTNGYAQAALPISNMTSEVDGNVCVEPNYNPCQNFAVFAVQAASLQLQPVAGNIQITAVGQNFQSVIIRVTDSSKTPNPVLGASVMIQSVIGRTDNNATIISTGDTNITRNPMPIILSSPPPSYLTSDANGLVSFQPSTGGFKGALLILGTASAGAGNLQFGLQSLWPVEN